MSDEQIEIESFDDFNNVNDEDIQMLLRQVDKNGLVYALITYPNTVPKFFENMSERAVRIVNEDMRAAGKIRVSTGEEYAEHIITVFNNLLANGEVTYQPPNEKGTIQYKKTHEMTLREYKILCSSILSLADSGKKRFFAARSTCASISKLITDTTNNQSCDVDDFDEVN